MPSIDKLIEFEPKLDSALTQVCRLGEQLKGNELGLKESGIIPRFQCKPVN